MESTNERQTPVLPLRDVVVYPHMAIPLFVGRERSIKAAAWSGATAIRIITT